MRPGRNRYDSPRIGERGDLLPHGDARCRTPFPCLGGECPCDEPGGRRGSGRHLLGAGRDGGPRRCSTGRAPSDPGESRGGSPLRSRPAGGRNTPLPRSGRRAGSPLGPGIRTPRSPRSRRVGRDRDIPGHPPRFGGTRLSRNRPRYAGTGGSHPFRDTSPPPRGAPAHPRTAGRSALPDLRRIGRNGMGPWRRARLRGGSPHRTPDRPLRSHLFAPPVAQPLPFRRTGPEASHFLCHESPRRSGTGRTRPPLRGDRSIHRWLRCRRPPRTDDALSGRLYEQRRSGHHARSPLGAEWGGNARRKLRRLLRTPGCRRHRSGKPFPLHDPPRR